MILTNYQLYQKVKLQWGGKWVYTTKQDQNGIETFKARYVAKGYSQVKGIDYQETFAPTASITSIRVLMQLAVKYDLIVHQMDVKGLVSGSCIAGFCYCLHFTQIQQIAIKIPCLVHF